MIEGSCHCGAIRWRFDGIPEAATACNCAICRRHGAIWGYDFENERIKVSGGHPDLRLGERRLGFHFCPVCGCVAYWRGLGTRKDGRRRMAVNLRLAEPDAVGPIAVDHFDGLRWKEGPREASIADIWF